MQKKLKKPISLQKKVSRAYKKASKAMQDYHRTLDLPCAGRGKSCHGRAEVIHHHVHWGQSRALRFRVINFVPLCYACHCAFHNGNFKIKHNYETYMRGIYGAGWEDVLIEVEQNEPHRTHKETLEYLEDIIIDYKNKI